MKKILILLLTLFIFPIQTIYGNELGIPKDRPLNLIYDPSNYINEDTENKLIELNKKYNEDLENQFEIGLVVIDTLNGENLENTANQIAKDWKIGFNSPEDKEKGILFLVAVNDRKYRSEISINGREIIPLSELDNISASVKNGFRQNDYSKGILTYLNKLDNEISKPNKSIDENTFLYKENFFSQTVKVRNSGEKIYLISKSVKTIATTFLIFSLFLIVFKYIFDKIFDGIKHYSSEISSEIPTSKKYNIRGNYYNSHNFNKKSKNKYPQNKIPEQNSINDLFLAHHIYNNHSNSYYNNHDSSSSSSNSFSDFGGFDGGGSSGDW